MPAAHSHRWDRAPGCSDRNGRDVLLTGSQAGSPSLLAQRSALKPKTGDYGGLLIFQDRASNTGATNTLNGSAGTKLVGAIYTATQTVSVSGGSGFGQQSPLMPIIADQIKFSWFDEGRQRRRDWVEMATPSLGRSPTSDPLARRSSPQRMSPKRCPRQTRSCPALADLTTSEASTRAASRNLKPRSSAASVPAPRPRSHMRGLERNRSPPCVDR